MFKFLSNFYNSVFDNRQYADLSFNSFLDRSEVGTNPDNELFDDVSLDELSFILDCEAENDFDNF